MICRRITNAGLRKIPYVSALLTLVAPLARVARSRTHTIRYGVAVAVAGILANSVTPPRLRSLRKRKKKKRKRKNEKEKTKKKKRKRKTDLAMTSIK